jgi:hypothetical protein
MQERARPNPLVLLLAAPALVFSIVAMLASLVIGVGLRCDEACGGETWRRSADGWQWDVIPLLGGIGLVAAVVLVVCVSRGRPWAALAALLTGMLALVFDLSWVEPDWRDSIARHPGTAAVCATVFVSGLVSALLAFGDD